VIPPHPAQPAGAGDDHLRGDQLQPPGTRSLSSLSPLLDALEAEVSLERLPRHLAGLAEAATRLLPSLQPIARARIKDILGSFIGGPHEAETLLRELYQLRPDRDAFRSVNGSIQLLLSDPADLELEQHWLVRGLVPAASIGALAAGHGTGKTFLACDLGLSVAFGIPFMGAEVAEARPVLFLATEGQVGLWRRFAGWLHANGFLPGKFALSSVRELLHGRVHVASNPPRLDHPDYEVGIANTAALHGMGLVVVDTLNRSLGPDQSENDTNVAGHVIRTWTNIAARTGATILFTHHFGHETTGRLRGAAAWGDGADFLYLIKGSKEELAAGAPLVLECRKMRDDVWPSALRYRLKPLLDLEADGVPVKSAVIEQLASSAEPAADSAMVQVFRFVEANPGCSKRAIRGLPGRDRTKDEALAALVALGSVEYAVNGSKHAYRANPKWHVDASGNLAGPTEGLFTCGPSDEGEVA
jgi:hypothetical protein